MHFSLSFLTVCFTQHLRGGGQGQISRIRLWDGNGIILGTCALKMFPQKHYNQARVEATAVSAAGQGSPPASRSASRSFHTLSPGCSGTYLQYEMLGSQCKHILRTSKIVLPTRENVEIPALLLEPAQSDILDIMESRPVPTRRYSDAETACIVLQAGTGMCELIKADLQIRLQS